MAAYSRREFALKNAIALKEAREVRYWLRLMVAAGVSDDRAVGPLLAESNELVAILTAVVRTARENAAASSRQASGPPRRT
jgi:four helix bundle protein